MRRNGSRRSATMWVCGGDNGAEVWPSLLPSFSTLALGSQPLGESGGSSSGRHRWSQGQGEQQRGRERERGGRAVSDRRAKDACQRWRHRNSQKKMREN